MFHGEYKQPGGKLVQVDFDIADSRLTGVRVSGDFFLYPEEALESIVAAVEGSPVDLTLERRTETIAAAISADVEWLGSSPDGLATAIQRALDAGATSNG